MGMTDNTVGIKGKKRSPLKDKWYPVVLRNAPKRAKGYAVELFAGIGNSDVARLSGLRHIAVEKDPAMAKRYKANHKSAEVFAGSWEAFIKENAERLPGIDTCVLDLDPTGGQFEALAAYLKAAKPTGTMLVFTTRGHLNERLRSKMNLAKSGPALCRKIVSVAKRFACEAQLVGWTPAFDGAAVVYGAFSIRGAGSRTPYIPALPDAKKAWTCELHKGTEDTEDFVLDLLEL